VDLSQVYAEQRVEHRTHVERQLPTMYLGLDATGVPVRPAEVEGRRGKQPDGSAKTREVKLEVAALAVEGEHDNRPLRWRLPSSARRAP